MSLAESVSDEAAREAAVEIATRWHFSRFAVPELVDSSELLDWLRKFLDWSSGLYFESPALWWLLMLGLLAVALALLAHVIWSVRLAMRASEVAVPHSRAAERPPLDVDADGLAQLGRFLEAAHTMHLACIARLVESGAVRLQRYDPNPALRAQLARAPLEARDRAEFLRLLDLLEQRWFRDRAPDARDAELFGAWRALYGRLRAGRVS